MTISAGELFEKSKLDPTGVVRWGEQVPLDFPGVYVIASTPDLSDPAGRIAEYRPNHSSFDSLRLACPFVTVDSEPATNDGLAERIGAYWIPESAILYVGLAGTSVQRRVHQYYGTRIGQRSPHAGGWWLKTLVDLETVFVHYAPAVAPRSTETLMLRTFAAAVPSSTRKRLHDRERIAPFANVEVSPGLRKRHGMARYLADRTTSRPPATAVVNHSNSRPSNLGIIKMPCSDFAADRRTRIESQVITEKDRSRSGLRIPARAKFALPAEDGFLTVNYRGQVIEARWRVNGSRSGTIGLGKAVMKSLGMPDRSVWLYVSGTSVVIEG